MSDIIHLLPDHIANQIAAGEVIQRPASVVKELVENSVDAGAKRITVNIKDAGRTLIQVIDNGKGMSETDARMAFERHATSKIASVDDLFALRTMGFRGEALASIAAVAQVELKTRPKDADTGTRLLIAGSALEVSEPSGCPEGSVFSVKNIFYNVPARRKFLKTNETEFRHIITEFERVALAHPDITFSLVHNENITMELPAGGLKQRIIDIFGKGINRKLLPIEVNTTLVKLKGFIGSPEEVKSRTSSLQYFFVNDRFMRHPYFGKAVMLAYENMIAAGLQPDYFIYFDIDAASIDVNIHPTKTEIKFENERAVWQILNAAVRESIAKSNSVPTIDFNAAKLIDIPPYNPHDEAHINARQPQLQLTPNYNPFEGLTRRPNDDWTKLYEGFEKGDISTDLTDLTGLTGLTGLTASEVESTSQVPLFEESKSEANSLCFQYHNRYIITCLKSGLAIIDRHRAHIRILYERLIKDVIMQRSVSQRLIFPQIIELTASEASLLQTHNEEIRFLGFEIEYMGGNSYAINGTPSDMSGGDPCSLIKDMLAAVAEGVSGVNRRAEAMTLSLARAMAVRAGKSMSHEEAETLIAQLFALENNGLTPDGLPIITIITDTELQERMKG